MKKLMPLKWLSKLLKSVESLFYNLHTKTFSICNQFKGHVYDSLPCQFLSFLCNSIKSLPALAFENLNSLETLSIQNNKLTTIPEEVVEPIIDTLRVVDIMGEFLMSPNYTFSFQI